MLFHKVVWLLVLIGISITAVAEEVKGDNKHARTWNQFAQNLLKFHQHRIKDIDVDVKEKIGGYTIFPDYYVQKDYFHDDKLIATVMWERENLRQLHSIEVFEHDDKGRVIRDYTAVYLPDYYDRPTQTLISLHNYNNGLHAFRTFDASGYRITERCMGVHKGKEIELLLDEDEIAEALEDAYIKKGIMMTADYKNCFGDLQADIDDNFLLIN